MEIENLSDGDSICAIGSLHLVTLLEKNLTFSHKAIYRAAANGHLEMVKWIYKNRVDWCGAFALDFAKSNQRLDVIHWINEIQYCFNCKNMKTYNETRCWYDDHSFCSRKCVELYIDKKMYL